MALGRSVLLALLLASGAAAYPAGWTRLVNTAPVNGTTILCPPNGFGQGVNGMPNVLFADFCHYIINGWNSAAVDTKRNRMLVFAGGHVAYQGNDVYSLDLVTTSATTCTGGPCRTNAAVPTFTRMNDPTLDTHYVDNLGNGCPLNAVRHTSATGVISPIQRHTFMQLVYVPEVDKLWTWDGPDYCAGTGGQQVHNTWMLNLPTMTWEEYPGTDALWADTVVGPTSMCVNDPTTAWASVLCVSGTSFGLVGRFNITAAPGHVINTWERVAPDNFNFMQPAGSGAMNVVVDPDRKLLFGMGGDIAGTAGIGKILSMDLTNPSLPYVDWTSSVTGCNILMTTPYPGLTWDPTIHKIVGYAPSVRGGSPGPFTAENHIYIFDPTAKTCVEQPQLGGAGPVVSPENGGTSGGGPNGTMGRFAWIPNVGDGTPGYVVVNNPRADAYVFKLYANATPGLGSSTYSCVDRDGDGFGTGESCTGPDADDMDAAVHTGAQLIAKWGSLKVGLQHLGYLPSRFWYLSPTGSDGATCNDTDGTTHIATPCATWAHISPSVLPGDMIIFRNGTYSFKVFPPTGTPGNPIILMSYPGELALFNTAASGINAQGTNKYLIFDGFKCATCNTSEQNFLSFEPSASPLNMDDFAYNQAKHIESTGNFWGILVDTTHDIIIEDSALYRNVAEHGTYDACHDGMGTDLSTRDCYNQFFRRNLYYDNGYGNGGNGGNGIHINGRFSNVIIEQAKCHGNFFACFDFQSGVHNSTMRNVECIDPGSSCITMLLYDAFCAADNPSAPPGTCPYGVKNNLFENITCYMQGVDPETGTTGAAQVGFSCVNISNSTAAFTGDMGHNTYRNIVASVPDELDHYAILEFNNFPTDTQYYSTSIVDGITYKKLDYGGFAAGTGFLGIKRPLGDFGYTNFNCSTAGAKLATLSNCHNSDPLYTSIGAWNNIPGFNLHLSGASLAVGSGVQSRGPQFDVDGNLLANAPTMGAHQFVGVVCTINTTSLPAATVGESYSATLAQSNCGASSWAGWTACGGLTLNPATGLISGTIAGGAQTCSSTVTFDTASRPLSVVIAAAPVITTASPLPAGAVGASYSQTFTSTGGTLPLTWDISAGTPPPGVALATSGLFSGVPSTVIGAPYTFTARVTDGVGIIGTKSITVNVTQPTVTGLKTAGPVVSGGNVVRR